MLKVAVVGATGYTGEELVRILASHPKVKVVSLTAKIDAPEKIQDLYPSLLGKIDMTCELPNAEKAARLADFIFLALPHRVSMEIAPVFLKRKKKVIDLSADYRLKKDVYAKWYGAAHKDAAGLKLAVYGLPEINRNKIKTARLIANPGCYPTSIVLGAAPLFKNDAADNGFVIADSKSGVTGAGRRADIALGFGEVNESLKAYKINEHQHSPEINQELSKLAKKDVAVVFVPHLVPISRGILSTIYVRLKKPLGTARVVEMYKKFYENEPFVRVLEEGKLPQLKDVRGTNLCVMGIKVDAKKGLCIIVSTIDNLTKGAAGQAVQNMNIMCGFKETEGLI
ncbi:MAG: N-acetyl-gamma-glutamyl-phosphate reductase [Candidatus Omnitrophica bacterium]|nr:N-acetyl-gamma-glutamyl-phosphate reductase [Candidatus Omnitrophota bacterium]